MSSTIPVKMLFDYVHFVLINVIKDWYFGCGPHHPAEKSVVINIWVCFQLPVLTNPFMPQMSTKKIGFNFNNVFCLCVCLCM